MPPRGSEMVSRADLGYEPTHQTTQQSSLEVKGSSHNQTEYANNYVRRQLRRPRNKSSDVSVDFSMDTIKIIEVEHMEDLPGEDIWYSRDEYDDIKARSSHIVRLIKCGEFEENDEMSCRGLEHKLKEVFRQRRANKFNALNAVLEEQDRQINRGITDDKLISAAYQTVSVKCQESANTIAFRDYRFSYSYSPDCPATGLNQPLPPETLGDSQSSLRKDKKKKKKDKKKDKDKKKEKEKHHKDKHKHKDKHRGGHHGGDEEEEDDDEEDDDDPTLSPKAGKKKGKVRKMARGARRMMRRMSM